VEHFDGLADIYHFVCFCYLIPPQNGSSEPAQEEVFNHLLLG
jgi:hypothetical protein